MTPRPHVLELLPWYVNGSLDEHEMARVTDHLSICSACAAEVDAAVALGRRVQPREREQQRLEELMEKRPAAYGALTRRIVAARPDRTRRLVLANLAAVVLFGLLTLLPRPQEKMFEAMTADRATGDRVVVQFAFRPETAESVSRAVVLESGGELLGNPSEQGVYRIAIPTSADVAARIAGLRAEPSVLWADREL